MSRRYLPALVIAALISVLSAHARPPNVVIISSDDHRNDVYGAYGNPRAPTPNLDRLAAEGIRFDRAYVNSPMCTTSRASFLTGRYARAIGVTLLQDALEEEEVTLADRLREAGYRAGAFGKMHFNSDLLHGFEVHRTPRQFWAHHRERPADRPLPEGVEVMPPWRPFRDPARVWLNADCRPVGRYDDEMPATWYVNEAVGFMAEHRDEPMFVIVSFHQPHSPFQFPVEYHGRIDPADMQIPPIGPEDVPQIPRIFADLTYRDKQGIKAAYYTSVAYLDQKVGEVLRAIDELGLRDDTLVIYLGDHGYHLGEHGRIEKHCFYEHAVKAPLVMRMPGRIEPGTATGALVEFVDLVPTVLDYLDVDPGEGGPLRDLHGHSLRPLIEGRAENVRDAVFSEYQPTQEAMIRTDRHKLIYHTGEVTDWLGYEPVMPPGRRTIRLYDVRADPDEFINLADDPDQADLVDHLLSRLADWYRRIPPKGESPPDGLAGADLLDWGIPTRSRPPGAAD